MTISIGKRNLLDLSAETRHQLVTRMVAASGQVPDVTTLFHLLRLQGAYDGQLKTPYGDRTDILRILTNEQRSKDVLGAPVPVVDRFGINLQGAAGPRVRSLADELHRDQGLATLAECGVPLDYPIEAATGSFTIADVLSSSVANSDINARELAWTAVALAAYMPERRAWQNKFGESWSFDDVAQHLMEAPLSQASCGGTHLLYALTYIHFVDSRYSILSQIMRRDVEAYLGNALTLAVDSQHADGSWHTAWHRQLDDAPPNGWTPKMDGRRSRLLATGHLAEWLLCLPANFDVPRETLRRAGAWLLQEMIDKPEEQIKQELCLCTHAVCVILYVSSG